MKPRWSLSICLLILAGCVSSRKFSPVDFNSPGWTVKQGQAIWKPEINKPEIAGDVVLATNPDGNAFVQFSKSFPLVTARLEPPYWTVEFATQQKRYSGKGKGPERIVWLQLLHLIESAAPGKHWQVEHPSSDSIALENRERGERLQVYFQP